MERLTIVFQYGGRPYLEQIARDFLKESLTCEYEFIDLDCSDKTIGRGFNELIGQVKTEFVLWLPDDFGFFPNGDWAEKGMKVLENQDIALIDLRKEKDNERPWMMAGREDGYFIVKNWDDRIFNLTPFMARTETIRKIIPIDEADTTGNIAEASGYEKFRRLDLKVARLDIPYLGVCFHLGWGRSCYFGYKEQK